MARKNPVTDSEKQICQRLLKFRKEYLSMTRAALALKLGIDANRLASYELAKVPLRFGVADKMGDYYLLSPIWLAEGIGHVTGPFNVVHQAQRETLKNRPFSEIYLKYIRPALGEARRFLAISKEEAAAHRAPEFAPEIRPGWYLDITFERLKQDFDHLHDSQKPGLLRAILSAAFEYKKNIILTHASITETVPAMRLLKGLMNKVESLVTEKGQKAALAKELGVAPETISRYLSGDMEPGGETTLKLLRWVGEQERAQKNPRSALTPPGLKQTLKKEDREVKPSKGHKK